MANKNKGIGCEKFGLIAGRVVVCVEGEKKGQELFSINWIEPKTFREGLYPAEVDGIAHYIVDKLNNDGDINEYIERYLGKFKWKK